MYLAALLLVVVYIRVSSDSQNIEMQLAAAEQYLKDIPKELQVILIDDGVSAIKLRMADRPKLKELLELIRSGKVGKLIVYDRDRLARHFFEYLSIVRLLHEREVNVIFTGSNVRPFDRSFVIEAIGAIFAQQEGLAIARRRSDAQRQYPSSLFGYKRHKSDVGKVTFTHSEDAPKMLEFFEAVSGVTSVDEFLTVLKQFKRILHRNEIRLLDMLRTPFYCGCWENNGEMLRLSHVEPIVPVDLFNTVQIRLAEFNAVTARIVAPDSDEAFVPPQCGLCKKPMKYRHDRLTDQAQYTCSNHRKVSISVNQLMNVTQQVMEKKVESLNVEAVLCECRAWLRNEQLKVTSKIVDVEDQMNRCSLFIVNNHGRPKAERMIRSLVDEQTTFERILLEARIQQQSYDVLKARLNLLAQLVTRYLNRSLLRQEELRTLAQMLIRCIDVYPNQIQFHVYFSKFFIDGGDQHGAS